jgi:peptide/nickel transport system substrate-binding protein
LRLRFQFGAPSLSPKSVRQVRPPSVTEHLPQDRYWTEVASSATICRSRAHACPVDPNGLWTRVVARSFWGEIEIMKVIRKVGAVAIALGLSLAAGGSLVDAKTFKYAFQGDLNALDPYTLNETFTLGALGNVMEGLTKRDKDLKIIPGLAEKWENPEPTRWRFHLRKGVKFHGGEDFTADDVVFSAERAKHPDSQIRSRMQAETKIVKVDDHTVDFITAVPNPIMFYEWDTWYIFSKTWAEANGAQAPQSAKSTSLNPWALKANGTGPFTIESHTPGVKTVFKPNPNWWGKPEHNLTEVIFQTIKSDATRVAALLSGEVDMMDPVPPQDIERINSNAKTQVLIGPELRTIFFNMDSFRDELKYSSVKGKNPFKDARVRKAFYQAIDIEAIKSKVMRGMSVPSAIMISPLLFSRGGEFKRHPYDVEAAKKLMEEAGYKDGFELRVDCPNDRYVNDEAICQATVAMLSRINVKANQKLSSSNLPAQRASTIRPSTCLGGLRDPAIATTSSTRSSAAAMQTAKAVRSTTAAGAIRK